MSAPTLINLPPPPSDPVTPSGPGTPNSTQTSMSELSTVAIKDGHRGHPHQHHSHGQQPASELADRISRLAGMNVAVRQYSSSSLPPGASASNPQGILDPNQYPQHKERSTVGSASATGSVGGRTTWADGSDAGEHGDNMTEDMDTSSQGGGSDNNSLVGFGEGASSTLSGPISTPQANARLLQQRQSYNARLASAGYRAEPEAEGMSPAVAGRSQGDADGDVDMDRGAPQQRPNT